MTIPAGRYPIFSDFDTDNVTFTGTTTIATGVVTGNVHFSNLPGPYGNDQTAATNGVLVGQLYYDANGHVKVRVS